MALFEEPAFVKPTHPKGDVIVFGKSPDLEVEDTKNGVARFGGLWRMPSYLTAYVRSAGILIEHAAKFNELDDIALPAFYMQRHALELLIKRLLSWLYEAAEYRSELGQTSTWTPSERQKQAFKRSHNLTRLLNDLHSSSHALGFQDSLVELRELVQSITQLENSDTWSRYEVSETKKGTIVRHIEKEIVVPLAEFQHRLELIVSKITYRFDGEDSYENELYCAWESAARATGRVG